MNILRNFLLIYVEFFQSDLYNELLIYLVCFGLVSAGFYLIWHIMRGY